MHDHVHIQIPTTAAISTKACTILANAGSMMRTVCTKKQAVAAARAAAAALVAMSAAYGAYNYYEQWRRAASVVFSTVYNGSAEIGSKVMAALKRGVKSLQHTTELMSVQVCVYLHLFTAYSLVHLLLTA
jgi:signal transduction histidine kinase